MTVTRGGLLFIALSAAAAVVVFVACAAIGLHLAGRDRVLPGVFVLGVPLGGLNVQQAAADLAPTSASVLDQQLELDAAGHSWTTTPRALGMRLDPAELAAGAFSLGHTGSWTSDVRAQLEALRSESVVSVTTTTDGAALDELMRRIASEIDTQPRDAELDMSDDGALTYHTSETGLALDKTASRALVARALAEGSPSVTLVTHVLPPNVTTEQVSAAHDQLARMLVDPAPIQVNAADQHWTLDRGQLMQTFTLNQPDGPGTTASVDFHEEPIQTLIETMSKAVDRDTQDARFSWDGADLTLLRPSHEGQALNRQAAMDLIKADILVGGRNVDVPVDVVRPAVAAEDAPNLGVRDLIGESTTSFAGAIPEKAHNIQLAARRLNGVVVPPGGTFSFNKEVGPTTLEAGFEWGFGLTTGGGGVHTVPSVAGGICQVATTLFQPVFWSGYQIDERYWHLYWIPAYTSRGIVGLDATVDADSGLDMKWINPTDKPVLIQASADAEHITFRLFGQKPPWTVQVDDPVVTDRVVADPTPEVQDEPSLPWGRTLLVESARDGFTVLLTRHVTPIGGGPVRELALKSIYAPAHTVTLVGTRGAPDANSIAAAVEQVRAAQQPLQVLAAPNPTAEPTHDTPNGPRTMAEIRDELRGAGWGGGSDQDALETYIRVSSAAR